MLQTFKHVQGRLGRTIYKVVSLFYCGVVTATMARQTIQPTVLGIEASLPSYMRLGTANPELIKVFSKKYL